MKHLSLCSGIGGLALPRHFKAMCKGEKRKMIDCLYDLLIEFDEMGFAPTTVCEDPEGYAKKWKDRVWEAVRTLEAENAALRERLEKAVELREPRITVDHWGGLYEVVHDEVKTVVEAYETQQEAEARLAELKERNNERH